MNFTLKIYGETQMVMKVNEVNRTAKRPSYLDRLFGMHHMFGYDDFFGEDSPVSNKGKTFWEVYPLGVNDGIYMARFTDNKWRVARAVHVADIQATTAHEWNSYKPGVFGVSRKEAQYFAIALWFEHAPVYEYFHEALMGAFKLNIKHPGTQHGINVLAGEYDEPKPAKYVTERREELQWPGFEKKTKG